MNSNILSDEQCVQFRRLPATFNDMVRAIFIIGNSYGKGHKVKDAIDGDEGFSTDEIIEYLEARGFDVRAGWMKL